jgi:spore germination protein GerM
MTKRILLLAGVLAVGAALLVLGLRTGRIDLTDYSDRELRWYSKVSEEGDFLIRGSRVDSVRLSARKLANAVNQTSAKPESLRLLRPGQEGRPAIKLRSIEQGIVNVEVVNSELLTQRMGTLGAQEFLATTTFTLTEHDGIHAVRFVFEPGDHAMPGVYTRESFLQSWRIAS